MDLEFAATNGNLKFPFYGELQHFSFIFGIKSPQD